MTKSLIVHCVQTDTDKQCNVFGELPIWSKMQKKKKEPCTIKGRTTSTNEICIFLLFSRSRGKTSLMEGDLLSTLHVLQSLKEILHRYWNYRRKSVLSSFYKQCQLSVCCWKRGFGVREKPGWGPQNAENMPTPGFEPMTFSGRDNSAIH